MIDVNEKMINIADSILKAAIREKIEQIYLDFGQRPDNLEYMTNRLYDEINRKYRSLNWGNVIKSFENILTGKFQISKINVHNVLVAIQKQCDWSEKQSRSLVMNEMVVAPPASKVEIGHIVDNSVAAAAVWKITKRCDGYYVDDITIKQAAEYISAGKNPDELLKS